MILFHGSTISVERPVIIDTQRLLDFGNGFYVTSSRKQAESWALIKRKRSPGNEQAVITVYSVTDNALDDSKLLVKIFNKATEDWLDFIFGNRNGTIQHEYDIVKGPVANDTLYATLLLYESGLLSKNETIARLKTHKLFDQISFHNKKAISMLKFLEFHNL
jgi:hypothetical protein